MSLKRAIDTEAEAPSRARGRRDPAATRDALLAAGSELFGAHGYDGATVDRIARKAGVNKALINYHFGGKRKFYLAILSSTLDELLARLEPLRRPTGRPAPALLEQFVTIFADVARHRRPNFPAMLLREVLAGGRVLDQEALPRVLGVFAVVRDIVERGVREGSFRRVDPALTHLSLVGSLVFFFATAPFRQRAAAAGRLPFAAPGTAEYVRHVQALMTRGLAAGRPAARARKVAAP
jgi:AcrR family transcriptional regulator